MLEALQQEEYFEERAHVRLDGPVEDDEDNFVVHPTTDDAGVWLRLGMLLFVTTFAWTYFVMSTL